MAGLGIFLYGLLQGTVSIGKSIDNAHMKNESFSYTDKGEQTWIDREGNRYINGEKIITKRIKKPDGFSDIVYIGQQSGKVYYDPQQDEKDILDKRSEENKRIAIENGKLAYLKYDHKLKRELTCEISTDRYIANLYCDSEGVYRKYYLSEKNYQKGWYCITEDGDKGIIITKEEFQKLDIFHGSHSKYIAERKIDLRILGRD